MSKIEKRNRIVLLGAILLCATPWVTPPIALILGAMLSVLNVVPKRLDLSGFASGLLKLSIVLLGFGLNLEQAMETSIKGFYVSTGFVFLTFMLGGIFFLAIRTESILSTLISIGTAICGGSAIAAVAPLLNASQKDLSLSLGVVFILNAAALFLFPIIGNWLDLTEIQFGYWAAIAVHDTSSVVGASAIFGEEALRIATTVKLTRALWIIPVSVVFSLIFRANEGSKIQVPWFIFLFAAAMVLRFYFPAGEVIFLSANSIGKTAMVITLLLIGANLSFREIKRIGVKPLIYGLGLWMIISIASLILIRRIF